MALKELGEGQLLTPWQPGSLGKEEELGTQEHFLPGHPQPSDAPPTRLHLLAA